MVFPWGNAKSSDNGQDIEYLLKIVRIRCKFNVFLTSCVTAWRGVCIPRKISSREDYSAKLKVTSFPQGEMPKIMWPAYTARRTGNNASGELT